jgi:hypothetical protein
MLPCVPTYKSAKGAPLCAPSVFEMVHLAAHFLGLCAAIRHIGTKSAPLYAPLALLMERIAAHFSRFSTNEPTIEPTKTQEIDERTRDSANEPEVRLVAPGRLDAARFLAFRRSALSTIVVGRAVSNPRESTRPNDPEHPLTVGPL